MKKTIMVAPAAFVAGKDVCPICGGKKSAGAKWTCVGCRKLYGSVVADAVDALWDSSEAAENGHSIATKGFRAISREIVRGPIIVDFHFNADNKYVKWNPENGKIKPFVAFTKSVSGGMLNAYGFGFDKADLGKRHTCLLEVKTKMSKAGQVHYLRLQKIPVGEAIEIRSTVRFSLKKHGDHSDLLMTAVGLEPLDVRDLVNAGDPHKERLLEYTIGFVPVEAKKAAAA